MAKGSPLTVARAAAESGPCSKNWPSPHSLSIPGGNRHHEVMLKPQKLSTASVLITKPGSFGPGVRPIQIPTPNLSSPRQPTSVVGGNFLRNLPSGARHGHSTVPPPLSFDHRGYRLRHAADSLSQPRRRPAANHPRRAFWKDPTRRESCVGSRRPAVANDGRGRHDGI